MGIVRINVHKVNAEKNPTARVGQVKINNTVAITNIEPLDMKLAGKAGCKFTFTFGSKFEPALGNIDSEYFDEEVDFAIREVGVILDSDPRKARAFEIEKWATYAGLSKDFIQQGINAVNNDDWDVQKNIYKDIIQALAKSPDWQVNVPSNAEINLMIAEEKAIQEAALASLQVEEINREWNQKINNQVKDIQPMAGLNTTHLQYAVLMEGTQERAFFDQEYNKIIDKNLVQSIQNEIDIKQAELDVINQEVQERTASQLRYGS